MIDVHLVIATGMALAFLALAFVTKSRYGLTMSPDGEFYFQAGRGELVPMPYCLRPLVPIVCGENQTAWYWVTYAHIALQGGFMYVLGILLGLTVTESIAATACFAVSRGSVRSQAHMPALVDAHAMAWSMLTACLMLSGYTYAGIAAAFVAVFISEKSVFFAALFAWSWLPLVAIPAAVIYQLVTGHDTKPTGIAWLDNPYEEWMANIVDRLHRRDWPVYFLAPFGVGLLGLCAGSKATYLAIFAALAPTVRFLDYTRLMAWGLPLLLIDTARIVPVPLLALMPIVHQYIVETMPND